MMNKNSKEFDTVYKRQKHGQQTSLQAILDHAYGDGETLSYLRGYFQKRAQIEFEYSKSLERLLEQYKDKFGDKSPNGGGGGGKHEAPEIDSLREGMNQIDLASSSRPCAVALELLIKDMTKQVQIRKKLAAELHHSLTNSTSFWDKSFALLFKKGGEFGHVLMSEYTKVYEDIPRARKLYIDLTMEKSSLQQKLDEYVKRKGEDESPKLILMKEKVQKLSKATQNARNDYILALQAANSCISGFQKTTIPKFFETVKTECINDLKKLLSDYCVAAEECHHQETASVEELSKSLNDITVPNEYEWFSTVKLPHDLIPSLSQLPFSFESVALSDVSELQVNEATTTTLMDMFQTFFHNRNRLLHQMSKLSEDIKGITQMVQVCQRNQNYSGIKTHLMQVYDFKFRHFILQSFLQLSQSQLQGLVEVGAHLYIPIIPILHDRAKVYKSYTSAHATDVSVNAGDLVKILDEGKVYNGWIKIRKMMNGEEGLIPSQILEDRESPRYALIVVTCFPYEASCLGELSFAVGDEIRVTSTDIGSEAWWAGERHMDGIEGQFPRALVAPKLTVSNICSPALPGDATPPSAPPLPRPSESVESIIIEGSSRSSIMSFGQQKTTIMAREEDFNAKLSAPVTTLEWDDSISTPEKSNDTSPPPSTAPIFLKF